MEYRLASSKGHAEHHNPGPINQLGFWLFLISDCLLFASIFACYAILNTHTDGGQGAKELFDVPIFVTETFLLLTSSFTSGLAMLALQKGKKAALLNWLVITAILGAGFIGLEVSEFANLVADGATISRSAFLTSFFTLVGTHGCHVTFGLIWMITLMVQIKKRGINAKTTNKVGLFSLYWHFLDAIWIFIFSVVYLMGVM
ncbi:cytochrome o ubiquinol oxidase subunit III [Tumebacillus flagellatus]|uniref:Cytochrome bo(3) ubiquinol oxidase subunit 3 n=1 Tax=Tumebacillus flagellatus TaxID=1157490 RepID=A0A074LPU7_9BACL|nr:cytochrome o ubiquinol oxidase subunit III [Tumebacillus flagellatus]KEO84136.1 cytochrome o ubiquinol oxidase subunit III [Tumebacillus flagellatus]